MNKQTIVGVLAGLIIGIAGTLGVSLAVKDSKPTTDIAAQVPIATTDHNAKTTSKLKDLTGDDFDKAFVEEMILHHQGAIDMAKLAETNAKHDQVKQLGKDIISAQSKEIDMMQAWQTGWKYKAAPQPHDPHHM